MLSAPYGESLSGYKILESFNGYKFLRIVKWFLKFKNRWVFIKIYESINVYKFSKSLSVDKNLRTI